jgi:hypothetical protein
MRTALLTSNEYPTMPVMVEPQRIKIDFKPTQPTLKT